MCVFFLHIGLLARAEHSDSSFEIPIRDTIDARATSVPTSSQTRQREQRGELEEPPPNPETPLCPALAWEQSHLPLIGVHKGVLWWLNQA